MKRAANFIEKIKLFFRSDSRLKTEKFIIAQKSCPHCASRGMFILKDTSIAQVNPKDSKLEPNVSLSLSKTDYNPK